MSITLYHGTTAKNAKQIERFGFVPDKKHNWEVKSKKGFVYLSTAYAPFYAMYAKPESNKLALIKVCVDTEDCYPEDDFLMRVLKKKIYTQAEINKIQLKDFKHLWKDSLGFMGNVAAKPNKIKIIGVRYFESKNLILKCDPSITPMNFQIMGEYYKKLTKWIYAGKDILKFEHQII